MASERTYCVVLYPSHREPYTRRSDTGLTLATAKRKVREWEDIGVRAAFALEPEAAPPTTTNEGAEGTTEDK